jgi:hypothetical protein
MFHPQQRTSGVASIEAVLLLPVFAIMLASVFFVGRLQLARAHARGDARRCALEHAVSGCGAAPPGCENLLHEQRQDPHANEAANLRARAAQSDSFGVLERVPLIGDAIDALFGTTTRARAEREVPLPWGKARAQVVASVTVICNERPRDVGTAIADVFCDRLPLLHCKGKP